MVEESDRKKGPEGAGKQRKKCQKAEDGGCRFQVNPTLWGYAMQSDFEEPKMGLRRYFKAIGVFMLLAMIGLWFLPGGVADTRMLIMKLALSLFFGAMGSIFLFAPPRCLRREVQFDLKRSEVRAGWLNRLGEFHMENLYSFDDVDVVMLLCEPDQPDTASLIVQMEDDGMSLIVAQATRDELEPWRNKLACDLSVTVAGTGKPKPARADLPLMLGPRMEGEGIAI